MIFPNRKGHKCARPCFGIRTVAATAALTVLIAALFPPHAAAQQKTILEITSAGGDKSAFRVAEVRNAEVSKASISGLVFKVWSKEGAELSDDARTLSFLKPTPINQLPDCGKDIRRIDYFDLSGRKLSAPHRGVTLILITYTDGTQQVAKQLL